MLPDALIGYTGFVGSNLFSQSAFDHLYNSRNIESIRGKRFRRIICAGVSAVKWLANQDPEADKAAIARLTEALRHVEADEFILISTVDVYPKSVDVSESSGENGDNHPYGRHRLQLERWCVANFGKTAIVRLPALFGSGIKKNVVYDLIHGNRLDIVNLRSSFQYYNLDRISTDIETTVANNIPLINLCSEPVKVQELVDRYFEGGDRPQMGSNPLSQQDYDVRTEYDKLFGGADGYIQSKDKVLDELVAFMRKEGRR